MAEQNIEKQEIVVVWFKRDLRFTDHEALYHAQKQELPILLLYCFEPSVMEYHDSDVRHWRFVYQSLQDMQAKLEDLSTQISIFHSEVLSCLIRHLMKQSLRDGVQKFEACLQIFLRRVDE